ncbi:restriction endonuclease subunit S [Leptospira levettii]|uniref:restriction endonuclease subunit S n=1 Tax=Leptospira levettii TaxID=2023178 RepID=UPI00223CE7E8|nr:restriction endonuclease subunit S [Leptospira levettii]MCW7498459.1 restriction endonuclease subunit S [Leptospira levettii]
MKWEKVEIGKISKVISGFAFKSKDFKPIGTPVVKIKNIKEEKVVLDESDCVDSTIEVPLRFHLSKGDILISLTGSHITLPSSVVGRVAKYRHEANSYLNQRAGKFINIDSSKCYNDYLFYFLLQKETLTKIANKAQGAANQANISPGDVEGVEINLPPLPTQRKIASILSSYDDLIENNLKRIKLLEEKASLHYKELVQEMSYSKSRRKEFIKDCLSFYIGGGWGEEDYKEKFTEPGYVIRGTDIPDVRGGNVSGVPLRFHKESNLESRKMEVGDIVFEISNGQINNIGRTVLISKRLLGQFHEPVMCASFAKLIRVNEKISPEFFYLYLNEGQENGLLYQYKSNSANGINNFAFETFIDEVKVTIPKESELKFFTEKVKPMFALISTLGEQNTKLREARDILLPRLMNGEIEV